MSRPRGLPTEAQIAAFWELFASIERQLASDPHDRATHRKLERQLASFGSVRWELGPGTTKPWAFVISPGGDADLLNVTKAVAAGAPHFDDWEIHHAKPVKQWNLTFEVLDETGVLAHIDAKPWSYVLYDFGDEVFDLTFQATNLPRLDAPVVERAVEILLEGLLGEEMRMSHIGRADLVTALPAEHAVKASPIENLRDHVEQLLGNVE